MALALLGDSFYVSLKDGKVQLTMRDRFTISIELLVRCNGTDQKVLFRMSSRSLGWPLFEVVQTQLSRLMPRTMVVMSRSADAAVRRTEHVNWDLEFEIGTLLVVAAPFAATALPPGAKDAIVASDVIPWKVPSVSAAIVPDIVWLFSSWRNRMMQADGPNRVSPPS